MLTYLLQGLALGFAAGISSGPMLSLVINQSLTRGARAGSGVLLLALGLALLWEGIVGLI